MEPLIPPPETSAPKKGGSPIVLGILAAILMLIVGGVGLGVYTLSETIKNNPELYKPDVGTPPSPVEEEPEAQPEQQPAEQPAQQPQANTPHKEPAATVAATKDPAVTRFVYKAISVGDIDGIRKALDMGYSPEQIGSFDITIEEDPETMLCMSVDNEKYDIAQLLLERGANPNAFCRKFLPINAPLEKGNFQFAETLIKHGASVDQHDRYGVLLLSRYVEYPRIIEFLLQHGATVNKLGIGKNIRLPLEDAVTQYEVTTRDRADVLESMTLLLKAGADPDLPGQRNTPWQQAEYRKQTDVLNLFSQYRKQ